VLLAIERDAVDAQSLKRPNIQSPREFANSPLRETSRVLVVRTQGQFLQCEVLPVPTGGFELRIVEPDGRNSSSDSAIRPISKAPERRHQRSH
jgi:hypothetical protein